MVTPVLVTDKEPWREKAKTRIPKAISAWALKTPYPSFELNDDAPPPDREPRAAVAFWLRNHSVEIAEAERRFHVTRIAIAGAIAWEALENPQPASVSSTSVGKMHLYADPPQISWPEAIEAAGKMPKLTLEQRKVQMRNSRIGTFYIGGLLDIMCEDAEKRGFNLRGCPEVLGQLYHSRKPGEWAKFISTKPLNEAWAMPYGAMGEWIARNIPYLESAVGKSQVP